MAEPTTDAGRTLVAWSDSDVRPITEFGWNTVLEAVCDIEIEVRATLDAARTDREGPGAAGLREARSVVAIAQGRVDALQHGADSPTVVYQRLAEDLEAAAAALRAPVAGERGDDANRECATCGDPIYCPSCASEASR